MWDCSVPGFLKRCLLNWFMRTAGGRGTATGTEVHRELERYLRSSQSRRICGAFLGALTGLERKALEHEHSSLMWMS
ncbi:hypothetical protein C8237_12790 [Paracidovorax avenae]|nr:hypothetical protein C8237_12790 [Paracidovorax avenae]